MSAEAEAGTSAGSAAEEGASADTARNGLAFFGGTFDPPHLGHLVVARDVAEALDLRALFFLPARVPPHKQDEVITPGEIRMEMLEAAVRDDEVLAVSDLELERDPPSYSVDTLRELRERIPDTDLHFVIGTDQLAELDTWKEPEELARLARLVVITRAGAEHGAGAEHRAGTERRAESRSVGSGETEGGAGRAAGNVAPAPSISSPVDVPFELVPVTRIDLSSTRIRARVREGRSIRYLVPDAVRRIIEREGLYK